MHMNPPQQNTARSVFDDLELIAARVRAQAESSRQVVRESKFT
jgi:hypothetical protein